MFNFKKLKIIACSLFIFLTLLSPMGNVFAEDIIDPLQILLLSNPTTWPLAGALEISKLLGLDATNNLLDNPTAVITNSIITAARSLITMAGSTIINLGQVILSTVIDSTSTWLSPTDFDPASETYNKVVATGWGVVRNVANAALVIGLVIIAINIILGREENKAKKTLINFIIIALLINFTPIICGFIIDGSNILTKSFVSGGINTTVTAVAEKEFVNAIGTSTLSILNSFAVSLAFLMFALISFFIYILYALLFLGRSIILWLLVIASPIAFATKVFPQSNYIKKIFPSVLYWDDWWESFMQWCVIGIPAGMSIYLANMLIPSITFTIDPTSLTSIIGSLVNSAIKCLTPFIILIAGFFISISAGGQIGSTVEGLAKGAWARTGGRAISKAKETAVAGGEWMVEGGKRTVAGAAVGGLSGISQGYSDAGIRGAAMGGLTGAAMGGLGAEGREKAAKRISEIKENIGFTRRGEYDAKISGEVEEAQKRLENLSNDKLKKITTSGTETRANNIDKAAAFNALNKRGELDKPELEYLASNKNWAETFNVKIKDIANARPDYAQKLINKSSSEVMGAMSPAERGKIINSSAYLNPEILSSIAGPNIKIIQEKLKKGTAKDIENIKNGYANLIKQHLPTATIDVKDLRGFTRDKLNRTAVKNVITSLKTSTNKEDKVMAQAIENLSNEAWAGKLN
jgi:hypothetical protein